MRKLLLVITLIAANSAMASAQKKGSKTVKTKGIAVAFFDEPRLQGSAGQTELEDFQFFFKSIQEIIRRDFPDVELRMLKHGELLRLPDGTRLNVQNVRPELGYVLSAPGK